MISRRVVILGGGFAGLHAARRLQRTLSSRRDLEVVLISREDYVPFTPLLHEVAAGDLDPADIVIPLRRTVRDVRLIQTDVLEGLEKLGATLQAKRGVADSGVASGG